MYMQLVLVPCTCRCRILFPNLFARHRNNSRFEFILGYISPQFIAYMLSRMRVIHNFNFIKMLRLKTRLKALSNNSTNNYFKHANISTWIYLSISPCISPLRTSLCYRAGHPLVFKRQWHKDEAEVKYKHGEPKGLRHLPTRHENTDEYCYEHGKEKNYRAA